MLLAGAGTSFGVWRSSVKAKTLLSLRMHRHPRKRSAGEVIALNSVRHTEFCAQDGAPRYKMASV